MATLGKRTSDQPITVRLLLACGAMAGPLFTIGWLVAGATRANYDPLRHFISSLSIGDLGWMQVANFIITGSLLLAFAVGLRQTRPPVSGAVLGPFVFGLIGLCLIGAGIFVTDPMLGYPPGTPLVPTVRTTHGILHDIFGVPFFLGLPIASFVFSRRFAKLDERGWAIYSALTGIGMLATFFFARLGTRLTPDFAYAGLLQRLTVTTGFAWITLLALKFMSKRPPIAA